MKTIKFLVEDFVSQFILQFANAQYLDTFNSAIDNRFGKLSKEQVTKV